MMRANWVSKLQAGGRSDEGRTLILGATGMVGRFLTLHLTEAGLRPLALSRRPLAENANTISADLGHPRLADRLPPISIVYSAAPIWMLPGAIPTLIERGMTHLIAFSSTSRFTKNTSPVKSERATAESLAGSEDLITSCCEAAGVAWTILRPTLIYAEGLDGNVSRISSLIERFGFMPLAGRGQGLRQPVHAEDLAFAALAAASSPSARNRAYNLPGGETLTYRAMVERIFVGSGQTARIVSIPAPLWMLAAYLASSVLPNVSAATGARMDTDLIFDSEPARHDLGWAPRAFRPRFEKRLA